jgi:hypothetical protein
MLCKAQTDCCLYTIARSCSVFSLGRIQSYKSLAQSDCRLQLCHQVHSSLLNLPQFIFPRTMPLISQTVSVFALLQLHAGPFVAQCCDPVADGRDCARWGRALHCRACACAWCLIQLYSLLAQCTSRCIPNSGGHLSSAVVISIRPNSITVEQCSVLSDP